jgi:hypothetical protein
VQTGSIQEVQNDDDSRDNHHNPRRRYDNERTNENDIEILEDSDTVALLNRPGKRTSHGHSKKKQSKAGSRLQAAEGTGNTNTSSQEQTIVYASTYRAVCLYSICIFVNATMVEGPFAAAESFLRAGVFLAASVPVGVYALFLNRHKAVFKLWKQLFRESLLCAAAAISLCVPFVACAVYRNFRIQQESDWELAPIPTCLGWVDARRLCCFTYGNGSFANNVRYDFDEESADRGGGELRIHDDHEVATNRDGVGIRSKDRVHGSRQDQAMPHERMRYNKLFDEILHRKSQDSWKGKIMLEPRRVQAVIISIVRGGDPLGLLRSSNSSTSTASSTES